MSNLRDEIRRYDLYQLRALEEFMQGLIAAKKNEDRKTVWRLCDNSGICHANFREGEYLKAAEHFAVIAKELDSDPHNTIRDRELRLVAERVPESEYDGYFNG